MNIKNNILFKNMFGKRINLLHIDNLTDVEIHEWSVEPNFFKHLEYENFKNISQSKDYLIKIKERSNSITGYYWTISLLNKKNIGNIGVININQQRKIAEITYGIHPNYWRKGYFKEAVKLVIKQLFEVHNFNRIWAITSCNNLGSINGLISCGFKSEGVLRQYYYDNKSKSYINAVILAIIHDDYLTT